MLSIISNLSLVTACHDELLFTMTQGPVVRFVTVLTLCIGRQVSQVVVKYCVMYLFDIMNLQTGVTGSCKALVLYLFDILNLQTGVTGNCKALCYICIVSYELVDRCHRWL